MDLGLKNKVVLITGGSKGIGLACARAFAAEGAKVAIASRSQANLDAARAALAKEGIEAFTFAANLSEAAPAHAMVAATEKALGPIEVLVNSAGAAKRHTMEEYELAAWQQGMNAKYYPYINAMDAVRPGMMARKSGAIVNIIGMGGKVGTPTHMSGGAANAALMVVTAGMANALGKLSIRVNGINPAGTYTERVQQATRAEAKTQGISEEEALARAQSRNPMGRFAQPEEVAAVAVFLASAKASYVTGALIPMDGALTPVI